VLPNVTIADTVTAIGTPRKINGDSRRRRANTIPAIASGYNV
jgi:hypothetical protein